MNERDALNQVPRLVDALCLQLIDIVCIGTAGVCMAVVVLRERTSAIRPQKCGRDAASNTGRNAKTLWEPTSESPLSANPEHRSLLEDNKSSTRCYLNTWRLSSLLRPDSMNILATSSTPRNMKSRHRLRLIHARILSAVRLFLSLCPMQ